MACTIICAFADSQQNSDLKRLYIVNAYINGSKSFSFSSKIKQLDSSGSIRQSVFVMVNDFSEPVMGMIQIFSNGVIFWNKIFGDITVSINNSGIVTLNLPKIAYDQILLISSEKIEEY